MAKRPRTDQGQVFKAKRKPDAIIDARSENSRTVDVDGTNKTMILPSGQRHDSAETGGVTEYPVEKARQRICAGRVYAGYAKAATLSTGYMHPMYAQSFREFGTPRQLPGCGGWILERPIPGTPYRDAMGCYPLFSCTNWSELQADLEQIGDDLVSLTMVPDPFGEYDVAYLQRCFRDVIVPYKEHYVIDLSLPIQDIVGRRHRKNARRALRGIEIDVCEKPGEFLETWMALYQYLIARHNISGIPAFSRDAFAKQLCAPGVVVLRASYQGAVVGAQIYMAAGDVVHCHLAAANQTGYDTGAIYALDYYSIEYFAGMARWLNLGGSAGIRDDGTDGLTLYKRGWCNETRLVHLCGRILNQERYEEIVKAKGVDAGGGYFPAYRKGEFV